MPNFSILKKVRRTVIEMLIDRKYKLNNDCHLDISIDKIKELYFKDNISMYILDKYDNKILVKFYQIKIGILQL